MVSRKVLAVLFAMTLVAAACGDSADLLPTQPPDTQPPVTTTQPPATVPPTTSPPTTVVTTTTMVPETGAVNSLSDVRNTVVQIVATGTFQDPFEGVQSNVPGSGSGFIIDESGLAVTNNHVVTGAALLEVFLDGVDRPRNARVVAASECSDLAVIDIEGDGYQFLDWFDGSVTAGLEIFAAGFPLGDPEYTLLDGIVSKEDVLGETNWASVDAVIEHSADTLPGNSGGPIVTRDGKIVAVNYAGNSIGQSFAIGIDVARPVVDRLVQGLDVDSIGVNGEALLAGGFSGIWVYSVDSGSPADRAGVRSGDLIITLEGIDLAVDGTMSDYCDVLRSHTADDVLTVEVYRAATDEILEGQINGRELEAVFSFATELDPPPPPADGGPVGYDAYVSVSDDTGQITTSVPAEWVDTNGFNWNYDGDLVGPALSAAPDLDAFINTWGTPGVFIAASASLPVDQTGLLDSQDFSGDCDYVDRLPYDDGLYTGEFDVWENCGAEGSTFLVVSAQPADGAFLILVQILVVDERDFDAADEIIATFQVSGVAV